jgi:hypothetical protein
MSGSLLRLRNRCAKTVVMVCVLACGIGGTAAGSSGIAVASQSHRSADVSAADSTQVHNAIVLPFTHSVVGMAATPTGKGYYEVGPTSGWRVSATRT